MKLHATMTNHAHSRAHERYGVTFAQLKDMGTKIAKGEGEFIRAKGTNEIWIVTEGPKTRGNRTNNPLRERRPSREFPIVWDPKTKTIVTVLPKFALRELHRELR